jgi:hypothetical protein
MNNTSFFHHSALRLTLLSLMAFGLFLVLFSCSGKEKQISIPKNVLPKEKMGRVITDVHLQEAEQSIRTLPDSTSKIPINFQKVFEKDTITKQQYEESLTFYIDHPQLLDSVYTQVLNELSKMQGVAGKK